MQRRRRAPEKRNHIAERPFESLVSLSDIDRL
jgi:hypothetical protein